jgi:hypothetical protein
LTRGVPRSEQRQSRDPWVQTKISNSSSFPLLETFDDADVDADVTDVDVVDVEGSSRSISFKNPLSDNVSFPKSTQICEPKGVINLASYLSSVALIPSRDSVPVPGLYIQLTTTPFCFNHFDRSAYNGLRKSRCEGQSLGGIGICNRNRPVEGFMDRGRGRGNSSVTVSVLAAVVVEYVCMR